MQQEQYGTRDLSYSAWHRAASIRRFIGWERAQLLSMVDADCVLFLEFERGSKEPLALVETAIDVGQDHKPATAITRLAIRARLPAYLVLYTRSHDENPADTRWRDLRHFRVKRLWPHSEREWRTLTPQEWAEGLLRVRSWQAARLDREIGSSGNWLQRFLSPHRTASGQSTNVGRGHDESGKIIYSV